MSRLPAAAEPTVDTAFAAVVGARLARDAGASVCMDVDARRKINVARKARSYTLLALLLAPMLAFGVARDRDQPMDVAAEHMEGELTANGQVVLRGDVRISQGTLKIEADRATVQRSGGEPSRIVFDGAPARMEQQLDAGGMTRAQARNIDYDPQQRIVVLTGDVVVTQPEGNLRGERVTYNIETGHLTGGESGGRIHMRIEPRQRPPAD